MELDDQLAALAAGELDAADARALEARVAADPALAARLARFEQLHAVLTGWEPPALSDDAVARLDAAVDEALAGLGDAPLRDAAPARGAGLRALPDVDRADDAPQAAAGTSGSTRGEVVDLDAARAERGVPRWVAGLGAAAAVLAVVGVGASTLGGFGASDEATMDTLASDDGAEESAESDMADAGGMADSGMADEAAPEALLEEAPADSAATAQMAPRRAFGVAVAAGELLTLAEPVAFTDDAEGSDGDAPREPEDAEGLATCLDEALTRDSDPGTERFVELLATGTYDGADAVFVVLRAPRDGGDDELRVFAYDPADCRLIESAGSSSAP